MSTPQERYQQQMQMQTSYHAQQQQQQHHQHNPAAMNLHPAQALRMAVQNQHVQQNFHRTQQQHWARQQHHGQQRQYAIQQQQQQMQRLQEQRNIHLHQHQHQQQQMIQQQRQPNSVGPLAGPPAGQFPQMNQQPQNNQINPRPNNVPEAQPVPQQPKPGDRSIGSIMISERMNEIVENPPPEFVNAYKALPSAITFLIANCLVFKFERRPALPADIDGYSPTASFFLKRLEKIGSGLVKKPLSLVGLRCSCCFRSGEYISGSTNFTNITADNAYVTLYSIIRSRQSHMASCPFVNNSIKGTLFSYKINSVDKKLLCNFLDLWVKLVREKYYKEILEPAPVPPEVLATLKDLETTDDSLERDLTSSLKAGSTMKKKSIIFNELGELLVTGKESARMEDFLQNFQIQILQHGCEFQAGVYCQHCSECIGGDLEFKDLSTASKNTWSVVVAHCVSCTKTPRSIQRRFRMETAEEPPTDDMIAFLKALVLHLRNMLRFTKLKFEPKKGADLYLPLAKEILLEYNPIPCQVGFIPRNDQVLPVRDLKPYDVIVGSEMHRDTEGNRRFRALISQHRPLYLQLSRERQEMVADTLTELVKKQEGEFVTLDNDGVKYPIQPSKCLEYVKEALQNGFPEMVREPLDRNAISKVQHISHPAKLGMFYQEIRWDTSAVPTQKYKLTDFTKRDESSTHLGVNISFLDTPKSAAGNYEPHPSELIVIDSDEESNDVSKKLFSDKVSQQQNDTVGVDHNGASAPEIGPSKPMGSPETPSNTNTVVAISDDSVEANAKSPETGTLCESQAPIVASKPGVSNEDTVDESAEPGEEPAGSHEKRKRLEIEEATNMHGNDSSGGGQQSPASAVINLCDEEAATKRPRIEGVSAPTRDNVAQPEQNINNEESHGTTSEVAAASQQPVSGSGEILTVPEDGASGNDDANKGHEQLVID